MFKTPGAANAFEIEVPEPLHVFKNRVIHVDNETLLLQAEDARLLSASKRKRMIQQRDALRIVLERVGWHDIVAGLEELKRQYAAVRAAIHNEQVNRTANQDNPLLMQLIDAEIEALHQQRRALIEKYNTINKYYSSPRLPEPMPIFTAWQRWRLPMTRIERLMAADTPIRRMARQLHHIEQRLSEHDDAISYKRQHEKLCAEMAKEAKLFARIIKMRWAALGYCYRFTVTRNGRTKTVTRYVKFARIEVTEDQIHYKIDSTSLGIWGQTNNEIPWGVSVGDLIKPDVLNELTTACQRQVTSPHLDEHVDFTNGAWITVNRLGSTDGLLDYIELRNVMATYKREWHEQLPFPMGVKRGRVVNWIRLTQQPHLLVAGQTGSGKSNVFNVFITTAIRMHSPDQLRLILGDLKEGSGLLKYAGIPHLLGNVITETHELDGVLQQLEVLRKQRNLKIRSIADNIDDYNRQVSPENRLTRIVVVLDEYQEVDAADKETRARIHKFTHLLAAKGRNVGIHLFLGTQIAYSDMMPSKIKGNITFVLTGRQRTIGASISTFGNKEAANLPKIPGRMYCDDGSDQFAVQIPYCTMTDIAEAMEASHQFEQPRPLELPTLTGGDSAAVRLFDAQMVLDLAIDQFEGNIRGTDLTPIAKDYGISRDKTYDIINAALERVQQDGGYTREGIHYQLIKHKRHHQLISGNPEIEAVSSNEKPEE